MNAMRTRERALAVLLVLAGSAACGGDGGTGPSKAELTGTWSASRIEYTNVANPAQKVDVAQQGATLTLGLQSGGVFTIALLVPGEAPVDISGLWSSSTDVLTLRWTSGAANNEMQFDMTLTGNSLSLVGADSEFDFDGDDVDDPATLSLTLTRQ